MAEEKTSRGTTKGIIIGVLAGGAAGALLGLLYAPKSGRELRRDIRKRKEVLVNDAEQYIKHAKNKASDLISDGRKKAGELISDAKDKAESISRGAEKIYTQGKDFISDETQKLKDAVKAGVDTFKEERSRHSGR